MTAAGGLPRHPTHRRLALPRRSDRWSGPYGPLRPARLLGELGVLVVAEALLLRVYGSYDSAFHWAAHFLVGLIAAVAWLTMVLLVTSRPARGQVLMVLPFHLYAMFPDLIYRQGVPHGRWSDAFLAHVRVHYMPGGDRTWVLLAALTVLAYAALLSRWVAARTTEAERGMPPGVGIGGTAVWTAQQDPQSTTLAHQHPAPARHGASVATGRAVVLLHGLGGTGATWTAAAAALHRHDSTAQVLVPDLLGHGASRTIGTSFALADQARAVSRLLDEHDLDDVVLVGHSYGAAVAVTAADTDRRVSGLVLVCPPAFDDAARTAERLSERSWLARRTVAGAPAASVVCGLMCLARPLLTRVAPNAAQGLPADVARGGVQHSYPAFRAGLRSLLDDNPLPDALRHPELPTTIVLGRDDHTVPTDEIRALQPDASVTVSVLDGGHQLTLQQPEALAELLHATRSAGE